MACNADLECGATWVAQISVVRFLSPSNTPHPAVHLPMAAPRAPMRRLPAAANDDHPRPANDNPLDHAAEA